MAAMVPCSMSGMAWVLCATEVILTVRPSCLKYPSLLARYRPALSTTGSAPTVIDVCSSLADAEGDADDPELAELDNPELLQPAARAATARPVAAVREIRPRRGDLIDAPYVGNSPKAVAWSIGAGGQRPALKLAPRANEAHPMPPRRMRAVQWTVRWRVISITASAGRPLSGAGIVREWFPSAFNGNNQK